MSYSTLCILYNHKLFEQLRGGGSSPSIACTDDRSDLEGLNLLCLKSTSLAIEICHAKELEMWYVPAGVSCKYGVDTSISSSVCVVGELRLK